MKRRTFFETVAAGFAALGFGVKSAADETHFGSGETGDWTEVRTGDQIFVGDDSGKPVVVVWRIPKAWEGKEGR